MVKTSIPFANWASGYRHYGVYGGSFYPYDSQPVFKFINTTDGNNSGYVIDINLGGSGKYTLKLAYSIGIIDLGH